MEDLQAYLQKGSFTVFAPGIDASIELNQVSEKMDHFLDSKDNANNFFFISYNIFDDHMHYHDAASEKAYLERNETHEMELLTDAGDQGWRYYMAGFRPEEFGIGGLGGIIIINEDLEKIKFFLAGKQKTWFVYGEKGKEARLFTV